MVNPLSEMEISTCIEDLEAGIYNLQLVIGEDECISLELNESSDSILAGDNGHALVLTDCSIIQAIDTGDGFVDWQTTEGSGIILDDQISAFQITFPRVTDPNPLTNSEGAIFLFTQDIDGNGYVHYERFPTGGSGVINLPSHPADQVKIGIKALLINPGQSFIVGTDEYTDATKVFQIIEADFHLGDRDLDPVLLGSILSFHDGCESVDLSSLVGGGMTIGALVISGTPDSILYLNNLGQLWEDLNFTRDEVTLFTRIQRTYGTTVIGWRSDLSLGFNFAGDVVDDGPNEAISGVFDLGVRLQSIMRFNDGITLSQATADSQHYLARHGTPASWTEMELLTTSARLGYNNGGGRAEFNVDANGHEIIGQRGSYYLPQTPGALGEVITRSVGNTSIWQAPALPALANANIWIGDATNTPIEHFMSGDGVLTNTGVLTLIGDRRVLPVKVTLSSAQILALHTTPVILTLVPGVNRAIDVLSASVRYTYNVTQYVGNTVLRIRHQGAGSNPIGVSNNVLGAVASRWGTFGLLEGVNNMIENVPLELYIDGAAATSGDGIIDVFITYMIKQL